MFFPDALWCQGIFLWKCLAGVKVHSVQKVLRFDAPMARGLWWAAAPPVCIKPLQPGCRSGKTGKPPCGRGKPYNRAFGAREIHPYPRLRRYFPRRGKSALHFALISYVVKSITVISHLRWLPPIRLRRTSSTGKHVTGFSGRFASLQHGYHRLTGFSGRYSSPTNPVRWL